MSFETTETAPVTQYKAIKFA